MLPEVSSMQQHGRLLHKSTGAVEAIGFSGSGFLVSVGPGFFLGAALSHTRLSF